MHNHLDWLPLAFAEQCHTPLLTTVHGFSGAGILPAYASARSSYVSISDADRVAELDYIATVYHGIDLMRRYAIGALLLDLHRPDRVIAELPGVLLSPDDTEHDGYLPNVVYSCGGLLHAGTLWLPYGANDTRVGFARVPLATVIGAMDDVPVR